MKKTSVIKGMVVSLGLLIGTTANAGLIRFTPLGETQGEQTITSPVLIGTDGFTTWFHGGGNKTVQDPLLLIIAVPDDTGAPTLTAVGGNAVSSIVAYDEFLDWSGTPNDLGDAFGLPSDNDLASQNISNYTDATDQYGIASTYIWDVFVYAINFDDPFQPGDSVSFTADLAEGTFVSGWGCLKLDDDECERATATPFTWTGLVTVPEPAMLSLLGSALIGFGLLGRRRRQAS